MLLVDSSLINARTQIYKNFNRFLADSWLQRPHTKMSTGESQWEEVALVCRGREAWGSGPWEGKPPESQDPLGKSESNNPREYNGRSQPTSSMTYRTPSIKTETKENAIPSSGRPRKLPGRGKKQLNFKSAWKN
jgi:hypothetical protein